MLTPPSIMSGDRKWSHAHLTSLWNDSTPTISWFITPVSGIRYGTEPLKSFTVIR